MQQKALSKGPDGNSSAVNLTVQPNYYQQKPSDMAGKRPSRTGGASEDYGDSRQENEFKEIREQVENIMKANKISHPVNRQSIMEICKHMNLRITQMQAIEAMLHCRGKLMEMATEEDYNFEKLIHFLHAKI